MENIDFKLQQEELKNELSSKTFSIKKRYERERYSKNEEIKKIKEEGEKNCLHIKSHFETKISKWKIVLVVTIILAIVSLAISCCMASSNSDAPFYFGFIFIALFYLPIFPAIMYGVISGKEKTMLKNVEKEVSEKVDILEKEIQRIDENENIQIRNITSDYNKRSIDQKSLEFTESNVANEVADFLFEKMLKAINELCVNSYSEQIELVLKFNVTQWKVECSIQNHYDEFNFLSKRCKELTNDIDRKALANALVLMVKLKLNEERIGKTQNVLVQYEGASNYEESGYIAYIAQNEYFEDERKW